MLDVTQILHQLENGDPSAADQLLPLVYDELRRLAAAKLNHEKPGQTLQATALVHEAYVRIVDQTTPQKWDGRGHFFAAAAEAMRRILVERARQKARPKHGGDRHRVVLDEACRDELPSPIDTLAIHEVLQQLELIEPDKATLVKLRYFAGFSVDEAADSLGISRATAKRHWAFAKAWLYARLSDEQE
ncbi:ECF-type sigma factor [Novipirellula artificiosorum]|uniref:RNA polymerase sigma factor SigL n=1 Tax=Novipirellula artificiosorum TaxID=2528016 RepID=A0A5C6CZ66_9BACT|nr:ECF-type sigma factor [Novipirellula artificiosorum]TWU28787.1 RNA polymerase sigma factor SigL [Novipirellula artificiosorum]